MGACTISACFGAPPGAMIICQWSCAPRPVATNSSTESRRHRLSVLSSAVTAVARGSYERFRRVRVDVAATEGKVVQVSEGGRVLGRGELVPGGRLATAKAIVPMPPRGTSYAPLSVLVDGRSVATVELPDLGKLRREALERAEMNFKPCVFSGNEFPEVTFVQPSFIEDAIGPYALRTAFFDAEFRPVTTAEKPGRYGAIVEIVPEDGQVTKRFLALFRQPQGLEWWRFEMPATIGLPAELGIAPAVVLERSKTLADYLKWEIRASFDRNN